MSKFFIPTTVGKILVPGYQDVRHIKLIQRSLLRLSSDPSYKRLIISIPIRHGKTLLAQLWVIFLLLSKPTLRILWVAHKADKAMEDVVFIQDAIKLLGYLTGVQLHPSFQSKSYFKTTVGGSLTAASVGQSVEGQTFDFIIVDDTISDLQEILNPVIRQNIYRDLNYKVFSRFNPIGITKYLVIGSRRHIADPIGLLLEKNISVAPAERWDYLNYPALDEHNVPLWPEAFPYENLMAIKRGLEVDGVSWQWNANYLCNPTGIPELTEFPLEYFDNIFYDILPSTVTPRLKILANDPSLGHDRKIGDYNALLYLILDTNGHIWVEDASIKVHNSEAVEDTMIAFWLKYIPDGIIVESNGPQELFVKNMIRKANEKSSSIPFPVHHWVNREDKNVRIRMSITPLLAQHKIHINKTVLDNQLLYRQATEFPTSVHDDGLDSLDLGIRLMLKLLQGPGPQQIRLI